MKKSIIGLLSIILFLSTATAYAAVYRVPPQVGIQISLPTAKKYGCTGTTTNGAVFKYVLNASTEAARQYQPAFYDFSAGNNYTVNVFDAINYGTPESFAGSWYCDSIGSTEVAASGYGWIQTAGFGNIRVKNTYGAITIGLPLSGAVSNGTAATEKAMRANSSGVTSEATPIAMEAQNSSSATNIKVFLGRAW